MLAFLMNTVNLKNWLEIYNSLNTKRINFIWYVKNKEMWGSDIHICSFDKKLSAAASVMQSSSKELSTLVADRVLKKCKQRLLLLFLKNKNTLKFP